jgi:ribosomal protein S18 acetylase RimI-like enzyme
VPILVAVEDGRILGSATLESEDAALGDDPIEPGTMNMRMLGVDPAARGRGAGRELVRECVRRARRDGKRALTLHTTGDMLAAQNLYAAMGFVRDSARDWEVAPDFTLYALRLDL